MLMQILIMSENGFVGYSLLESFLKTNIIQDSLQSKANFC